jgi:hypothetical protein
MCSLMLVSEFVFDSDLAFFKRYTDHRVIQVSSLNSYRFDSLRSFRSSKITQKLTIFLRSPITFTSQFTSNSFKQARIKTKKEQKSKKESV